MTDKTIKFSIKDENEAEMKKNLLAVVEIKEEMKEEAEEDKKLSPVTSEIMR